MLRQVTAMLLCALVLWPNAVLAARTDDSPIGTDWAAAVREADAKGFNYVEFRLLDGRKVKGYVLSVGRRQARPVQVGERRRRC